MLVLFYRKGKLNQTAPSSANSGKKVLYKPD